MLDFLRFLLFPAIVVIAWQLALRWPATARRIAWLLAAATGIFLLTLAVTGLVRPAGVTADIHKWTGHGLVIFIWLAVPFTIGVVLRSVGQRRSGIAVKILALLALFGIALLASMTGYLGPSHGTGDLETLHRFNVLHQLVLPGLAAGLTLYWFRLLQP